MSNIPLARAILEKALREYPPRTAAIRHALSFMHRRKPAFRARSRRVNRIDKRVRADIRAYRRAGWSIPDIAITLGLNARSVSNIINENRR